MRLLMLLLFMLPGVAQAATVSLTVRSPAGKPLPNAVVQIDSPRKPAAASRLPGPYVVAQKDIAFQPHILIVPVGAAVSFPNRDKVRHHVYSFSTAKTFELKLYPQGETRSVVFDRSGVVALGCNIHDLMTGFVIVVDTPFAAQTNAAGQVSIDDVPPGPITVTVWHPSLSGGNSMQSKVMTLGPQGLSTTFAATKQ
jgi:plastocyanin